MSGHAAGDERVGVRTAWCAQCHDETWTEIVWLATDPVQVSICLDCGNAGESWWQPELVPVPLPRSRGLASAS